MRDSFDHYFAGWTLDEQHNQSEFTTLVAAVGSYLEAPGPAEAWRTFPLDGKKDCFLHFTKLASDSGALPASVQPLVERLKKEFPRSFV